MVMLWQRLAEKWPEAHARYTGPFEDLGRDEEVSWDGAIHVVIRERFPDLSVYPDRHLIYSDMNSFLGFQRVRMILERGCIQDETDFHTAKNSLGGYCEQIRLDGADRAQVQRLIAEYEERRPR